jgi:hypothetical protein
MKDCEENHFAVRIGGLFDKIRTHTLSSAK